jgi:protein involved in polysaccharide export with SLBB domain
MFNKLLAFAAPAVFSVLVSSLAVVQPAAAQTSNNQQPFPFSAPPSAAERSAMGSGQQQGQGFNPGMANGGFGQQRGFGFNNTGSNTGEEELKNDPQNSQQQNPEIKLPKKPLSGFQQFVFDTTGRILPNFGDNALQKTVRLNNANQPVSADYEIGAGDEILVRVWGAVDVNVNAQVDRDGQLTIPSVGTFPVAGVKARNLDDFLKSQVGQYYKNFSLSATLGKLGGVNIYVAGQALAPGMHLVNSTSTLASVVFGVAQPGINGSFRSVQLRRAGQTVATFDLYELLAKGSMKGDRKLQAGDVVFIGQAGKRVALNIEGPAAAIFELKEGETLANVLATAGVDTTLLRQDTVLIEGFNAANPQAPRGVEQISYTRALQEATLRDGDIVTIFQARRAFSNAVTLKGAVADPARYPHFSGMTVADLIPNTDVLLQPDYFKKKSALVGYNKSRADRAMQDPRLQETLTIEEQIEQQQRMKLLSNPPDLFITDPRTGELIENPAAKQFSERKEQAKLGAVEDTVKNLLPTLNWDYAVIERLNRTELKPEVVPFNLRKAMARDPQHNLVLQPGDVVTIFSADQADIPKARKTALIKVTGEVAAPGYYQVAPGETLRDVLVKAGGLTQDAFLFGTVLERKSIQKQQEQQYKRALEQAERLLLAATNANAASALNAADAASVQTQAANQRLYLERLKERKPDGRVVLEVDPKANSIAEMPPLVLDDGDSITIPTLPTQVGIFGSVYTQGAFAYQKGRTVFDYLDLAGGAAKSADKGSIFVLRANGTVDSAQQGWVPFVSGLYGRNALPGDTIYVPEDFERVSFMKGLLDISQIFYQVGLGAAAINVLRD